MDSDSPAAPDTERRSLVCSALRLSYFTIAWNGVFGATALVVGVATGSIALAAFALNVLLDSSASVVLVWSFRKERSDPVAAHHLERRATDMDGRRDGRGGDLRWRRFDLFDIVVRDRDPAEEEIPSVILPAQDSK